MYNDFHVKAEYKRFAAADSSCRQNLKYENFMSSFGRLRQQITPKRVLHDYFSYFLLLSVSRLWLLALSYQFLADLAPWLCCSGYHEGGLMLSYK